MPKAKTEKQPRRPWMPKASVDGSRNKLSVQTGECYSVPKRNALLGHEKARRNLKHILPSVRNQPEKATYLHDSNYMAFWKSWNFRHDKNQLLPGVRGGKDK